MTVTLATRQSVRPATLLCPRKQGAVYVWTLAPPEPEADVPLSVDEWYGVRASDAEAPLGEFPVHYPVLRLSSAFVRRHCPSTSGVLCSCDRCRGAAGWVAFSRLRDLSRA